MKRVAFIKNNTVNLVLNTDENIADFIVSGDQIVDLEGYPYVDVDWNYNNQIFSAPQIHQLPERPTDGHYDFDPITNSWVKDENIV